MHLRDVCKDFGGSDAQHNAFRAEREIDLLLQQSIRCSSGKNTEMLIGEREIWLVILFKHFSDVSFTLIVRDVCEHKQWHVRHR